MWNAGSMYVFRIFDTSLGRYVRVRIANDKQAGVDVMKCEKVQGMQEFSQAEINKIRDEKLKLKAVVADLTQVNRRWQRYNNDMQIYIKKLHSTIEDQQEQLNNIADKKAERLFSQTTQENEAGNSSCKKCRPVLDYLKFKVTTLEEELSTLSPRENQKPSCPHCSQRIQDSTSEILSLQFRLDQACKHIDYLNSLMVNKGVLKTGYNFLPESQSCRLEEKLRSTDGLNFYECDSRSDLATTSTDINCKGFKKSTWEATDDPDQSSAHSVTPKGASKDFGLGSSPSFQDRLNEDIVEVQPEITRCSISKSMDENIEETLLNKLPPDRCNEEGQSTSSTIGDQSKSSSKENTNYYHPLDDHLFKSNHSGLSTSGSSSSSKLSPPLDIYNLDSLQFYNGRDFYDDALIINLSMSPPLFCPHCHTVFPPDSSASYTRHILSCRLS